MRERYFVAVEGDALEGALVQFIGVYALRWFAHPEYPTIGFHSDVDQDLLNAAPKMLDILERVLCAFEGNYAFDWGEIEKVIQEAKGEIEND